MLFSYFNRMLERETEQGKRENLLFQTIYDMVYQNMEKYGAEFAGIQAGNSATERMTGQSGTECMILETDGTITLEGSLKLKEISYIHAEGYSAAEMKHGPIALIDSDMPVVVVATHDAMYEKVRSNVQEIKAREGRVIAFVSKGEQDITRMADATIELPDTLECLEPLMATVPLQLLAYYIAVCKGKDVDQPRNLAKSVTVE